MDHQYATVSTAQAMNDLCICRRPLAIRLRWKINLGRFAPESGVVLVVGESARPMKMNFN
jgi:hypothetical protein